MPAAYFEDLGARPLEQWPDFLNLQGVSEFDPNDPLYYAMEHCLEQRVKQTRWINDNSVNLQYYNAADAALALHALTDPGAGDPTSIPPEQGRKARPYSKRPGVVLSIRQANAGDQKARGAANRSNFYKQNPDLRGDGGDSGRERQPRRREPRRDVLDYGDETSSRSRRRRYGLSLASRASACSQPAKIGRCRDLLLIRSSHGRPRHVTISLETRHANLSIA